MKITFLGTGTSLGVPMVACNCAVCRSIDPRDKRLRSAVLVETKGRNIIIDIGPDFRQQMLRAEVQDIDDVLITHEHRDHINGIDEVRAFNFICEKNIPLYATARVHAAIREGFSYIFDNTYPGLPQITQHTIAAYQNFNLGDVCIQVFEVMHYQLPVLGFRINDFSYITDANFMDDRALEIIAGSKILVLNALRKEPHISHFTLREAIEMAQKINAEQTYFTHISHQLGKHAEVSSILPPNIHLAYDGLSLVC
ncbi:MAG: MBL fold metallo-hydrolase [Chitinophagales bacterium]|nr:MBL fold metallo-hydrolase [Bacteroidota bacterium]MCB9042725.1 MBL fold metallo-hydrolase [Chitinophagales bacterium]